MVRPILLGAMFTLSVAANAANAPETSGPTVSVYGLGGKNTCGAFIRSLNTPDYLHYFDYAAGYITGQNMALPNGGNVLGTADLNDGMLVVEKFCRDNPLKTFLGGLIMLVNGVAKE